MALDSAEEALIEQYLDSLWLEKGLSQNTLDSYRRDIIAFAEWLSAKSRKLKDVHRDDVTGYLAHRLSKGIKARTTARSL